MGKPKLGEDRVIFMGSSITEGWSATVPKYWNKHPNYINRGVGGETTPQILLRFRANVVQLAPKVVVILAKNKDITENIGFTTSQTIANNIFTMADLAQQHVIKVVICSILPAYDYPRKKGLQPASKIIEINTLLKAYAQSNGFHYTNYHSQMKDHKNGLIKEFTNDGVHLTKAGYLKLE